MQPQQAVRIARVEQRAEAVAEVVRLRLPQVGQLAAPLEDELRRGRHPPPPLLVPLRHLELRLAVDAMERVRLEHLPSARAPRHAVV
eukprot:4383307-Prymnesium_polylepis.1